MMDQGQMPMQGMTDQAAAPAAAANQYQTPIVQALMQNLNPQELQQLDMLIEEHIGPDLAMLLAKGIPELAPLMQMISQGGGIDQAQGQAQPVAEEVPEQNALQQFTARDQYPTPLRFGRR